MSQKARQKQSKARVSAYERLLALESSVELGTVELHIPSGPRLGELVVEGEHVVKGFGDRSSSRTSRSRCRPVASLA